MKRTLRYLIKTREHMDMWEAPLVRCHGVPPRAWSRGRALGMSPVDRPIGGVKETALMGCG